MALTAPQRKKLLLRLINRFLNGTMTDAQRNSFQIDMGAALGTSLDAAWLEPEKALLISELNAGKVAANATITAIDAEITSLG